MQHDHHAGHRQSSIPHQSHTKPTKKEGLSFRSTKTLSYLQPIQRESLGKKGYQKPGQLDPRSRIMRSFKLGAFRPASGVLGRNQKLSHASAREKFAVGVSWDVPGLGDWLIDHGTVHTVYAAQHVGDVCGNELAVTTCIN